MSSFFSVVQPAPSKVRQANSYTDKYGNKHPWKTPKKSAKTIRGGLKKSAKAIARDER